MSSCVNNTVARRILNMNSTLKFISFGPWKCGWDTQVLKYACDLSGLLVQVADSILFRRAQGVPIKPPLLRNSQSQATVAGPRPYSSTENCPAPAISFRRYLLLFLPRYLPPSLVLRAKRCLDCASITNTICSRHAGFCPLVCQTFCPSSG